MAQISDLTFSIRELSEPALLDHILLIRERRLTPLTPAKPAKKAATRAKNSPKQLDLFAQARVMTSDMKQELLNALLNS